MNEVRQKLFDELFSVIQHTGYELSDIFDLLAVAIKQRHHVTYALAAHARDVAQESEQRGEVPSATALMSEIYRRTFYDPAAVAKYSRNLLPDEKLAEFTRLVADNLRMDARQTEKGSYHATPGATQ